MGQVDPKFNFDFDVLDPGTYRVKVKETGIAPEGEGKTSGKRYWARLVVVGGDQDGLSHIESFFEKTKEDFSFSKMAGFLYKAGFIKTLGKVNTDIFLKSEFEERWKKSLPGMELGIKTKYRYQKEDKNKDNPQSDVKVYLSLDEVMAILNKGKGTPASAATGGAVAPASTEPAPWD